MADVNEEMKSTAYFAIKSAKERFSQELDYSTQSIARLENLLGHIYWGFSNHTKDEGENGVIFNTAIIWGSYLGEYMRLIWGGKWVVKGGVDPIISIDNIEFSPISMIYQKITSQPDYSLEDYLIETKRIIDSAVIPQKKPQPVTEDSRADIREELRQLQEEGPILQSDRPRSFNKRLLLALAGIGGVLFVTLAIIIGYKIIRPNIIPAIGVDATATSSDPAGTLTTTLAIATSYSTITLTPTATLFPTYTPSPSNTPIPSNTPNLTETLIAAFTATETQTPSPPTPTRTPTRTRTPITPTATHVPATEVPPPTITPQPSPTSTQPPPVVLESCAVDPNTVQAGINTPITFIAHFSGPGYGFSAKIQGNYPGQSDCSGTDDNGDGTASCGGSSGLLPGSTKVDVNFSSPVGNCTASYSSP